MNIYHSYFRFWRNFPDKLDYTWVAITKTIPPDFIGCIYKRLAPIGARFDVTIEPIFDEKAFFIEYSKMLHELDRNEVLNEIKSFSKRGKDIVLLNWEDLTKKSEGRFAYAWLMGMSMQEAGKMDLETVLKARSLTKDLSGMNFLRV